MNTKVKKLEECKVEIKVTFDGEEWSKAQNNALNAAAAKVKIDGFRQGKAPLKMVKARLGASYIMQEACDQLLNTNYYSIIVDNKIEPVASPEANVTSLTEEKAEVTLTCIVAPEVKLGEWKGLDVKKKTVKVSKKEVEARLADYQKQFSELVIKEDGAVENGDTAVIDYEGFKDGVAFDGGKAEKYPLEIGSGSFIPGFEEQLIGMKVGEEKSINLTFPEEYGAEDLAGQDVVFNVKLHEIKTRQLPEIDDELAKDVNIEGVETLADLEKHIKEEIKTNKEAEAEGEFNQALYKALVTCTPIELPEVMIDNEKDQMIREMESNLSQQGITLDLYTQITGKSVDDLKDDMSEQATERVKVNLILSEIVKEEKIEVSDDELNEELTQIATYYGREVEDVKRLFESQGQLSFIKNDIAVRKALDLVKENLK